MWKKLAALLAALAVTSGAYAADGYFDSSWGTKGRVMFGPDDALLSTLTRIVIAPDGSVIVAGSGIPNWWIGKLTPRGTPAPTFGERNGSGLITACRLHASLCRHLNLAAISLPGDGGILLLDTATLIRTLPDARGVDDRVGGGTGMAPLDQSVNDVGGKFSAGYAFAQTADGGFLIAGEGRYSAVGGATAALLKLKSDFTVDVSFNKHTDRDGVRFAGGLVTDEMDLALAASTDSLGRITVLGTAASPDGYAAMRFASNGDLDTGFGTGGTTLLPSAEHHSYVGWSHQDAAGRTLVVGGALVQRMTPDGQHDLSFGISGRATIKPVTDPCEAMSWHGVTTDSAGRILLAGLCAKGAREEFLVARLFGDTGELDKSFGYQGFGYGNFALTNDGNSAAYVIALDAGGRPLVGGTGSRRAAVARLQYDLIFTNGMESVPRGRLK